MKSPEISIIIPVYNVSKYLRECLDSAVNQTFKDIEIVCVNDCSTDNSLEILKEYQSKDNRIVIVDKEKNEGTMLARKSGIEVANGEYSVFLDADDYIDSNLCSIIVEEAKKNNADILHFSMGVLGSYSGINVHQFKQNMAPYEAFLKSGDIIKAAYIERKFASQLCGKAIRTSVCVKASEYLPDERCHVGEDVFTFFVTALFAESYQGIASQELYFYRFGVGVSNLRALELSKFELFCKMSNWYRYASDIITELSYDELYKQAALKMAERLFDDCSEMYDTRIKFEDKAAATDLMIQYWNDIPVDDLLWHKNTGLNKEYFINQANIREYEIVSDTAKSTPVLTVVVIADKYTEAADNICKLADIGTDNIEFIYVNNGKEKFDDIINKISQNNNISSIINSKYRGNVYPVEISTEKAHGKYIYFTRADSHFNADYFKELVSILSVSDEDLLYLADKEADIRDFTSETMIETIINAGVNQINISDYVISTALLKKNINCIDVSVQYYQMVVVPMLITYAKTIKAIPCASISGNNKTVVETPYNAFSFIDCFKAYTKLVSNVILNTSIGKDIINAVNRLNNSYYNLCKDIYFALSLSEVKQIDKYLDDSYKTLFFDIRELRRTQMTLPYKIANKFLKFLN